MISDKGDGGSKARKASFMDGPQVNELVLKIIEDRRTTYRCHNRVSFFGVGKLGSEIHSSWWSLWANRVP